MVKKGWKIFMIICIILLFVLIVTSKLKFNIPILNPKTTIEDLNEKPTEFLGKNITIEGWVGAIPQCITRDYQFPDCYDNLYIENKNTIPSSRKSVYIKVEGGMIGGYWKCSGIFKENEEFFYLDVDMCECIKGICLN